jgi:predicted glycosyltransferase
MRFVVDVLHPIDAHIFHHFIEQMTDKGHEFMIMSRHKECAVDLLDAWEMEHHILSSRGKGISGKLVELGVRTAKFVRLARPFKPDYLLSEAGPGVAAASPFLRARSIILHDTDHTRIPNRMIARLSAAYLVPAGFSDTVGPNQVQYPSYQQLAYLHPNVFTPNIEVVRRHGLVGDEPLYVVRFVEMDAYHDLSEKGFSYEAKAELIRRLAARGRVVITSEEPLPEEFQKYQLAIPFEDIHHVLAYADLLVGESCSMAAEAAVLGTHGLWIAHTWRGFINDLSDRYGLVHHFSDTQADEAIAKAEELLDRPDLKADARTRADRLLAENVDLTEWLIDFVEKDAARGH